MSFFSPFIRSWCELTKRGAKKRRGRRGSFRPLLEQLEDKVVPSALAIQQIGGNTSPDSSQLLPDASQYTVSGVLNNPGEQNYYTFNASAGEEISLGAMYQPTSDWIPSYSSLDLQTIAEAVDSVATQTNSPNPLHIEQSDQTQPLSLATSASAAVTRAADSNTLSASASWISSSEGTLKIAGKDNANFDVNDPVAAGSSTSDVDWDYQFLPLASGTLYVDYSVPNINPQWSQSIVQIQLDGDSRADSGLGTESFSLTAGIGVDFHIHTHLVDANAILGSSRETVTCHFHFVPSFPQPQLTLTGPDGSTFTGTTTLDADAMASGPYVVSFGDLSPGMGSYLLDLVLVAPTTLTLSATPSPSVFGQPFILTATVDPSVPEAGTPSGQVQFFADGTLLGSQTLTDGTATLSTSGLSLGNHTIVACYSGDDTFDPSSSFTIVQEVDQADTTTTLNAVPNPSTLGQSVTISATVSPTQPGDSFPTGQVQFFDGLKLLGASNLVSGVAKISTTSLTLGSHDITASYSGDGNFNASTSDVLKQQVRATTTTKLSATATTWVFGQGVAITAKVTSGSTAIKGVPSGQVQFYDGQLPLGSATVVAGIATLTSSNLSVGPHSITAVYSGDSAFAPSSSLVLSQTVNKGSTTITLSATPNSASVGQTVTLKASIAAGTSNAGTPGGQIQFFDGKTLIGGATVVAGVASLSTSKLTLGSHSLSAVYCGDGNYSTSTSAILTQQIKPGTITTLSATPNPANFGQAVTLKAGVAVGSSNASTPSGKVQFFDGQILLGSANLVKGVATLSLSTLAVGTHSLTAVYGGDTNFAPSSSSVWTHTVLPAITSLTISASVRTSAYGKPLTLIATVTPGTVNGVIVTGDVTFMDGTVILGTATVDKTGRASLITTQLTKGKHTITAIYSGDANFIGVTGGNWIETIV